MTERLQGTCIYSPRLSVSSNRECVCKSGAENRRLAVVINCYDIITDGVCLVGCCAAQISRSTLLCA